MPEIDYTLPILDIIAIVIAVIAIIVSVWVAYHVSNLHSKTNITHDLLKEISSKIDALIKALNSR